MRVTHSEHLHSILSEMMGSRGLVSLNQRIIFIEGEESSADRDIYEALYPPSKYNISFVSAGNSATVRKTAEKVNELLTTSLGFQQFFSIVDGDIQRPGAEVNYNNRLFRLPVYHVENFLLEENRILEVTQSLLGRKCPYTSKEEICKELEGLILSDIHLNAYSKALLDAKLAKVAKDAYDAAYDSNSQFSVLPKNLEYSNIKKEAKKALESFIKDGNWRSKCKGRDLLKAYCSIHGIKYEYFRNLLVNKMSTPPKALADIMDKILDRNN